MADAMAPATARLVDAVDHDLQHAVHALVQFRRHAAAQRGTEGVGGRGGQGLVARPHLTPATNDSARKGRNHAGYQVNGLDRLPRRGKGPRLVDGLNENIPAGHPLRRADRSLPPEIRRPSRGFASNDASR